MKRIILPFFISFIILITANISYADLATKAKVNVTAVRIRESVSTQSNIIKNIYQEDEVEVLGENGEWYKIKYGDTVGYAKAEFFTITQQGDLVDNPSSSENSTNEIEAQNNVTEESVVNNTESEITVNQNVATNQETTETAIQKLNIGDSITLSNILNVRLIPSLSASTKLEIAQGTNVTIEAKLGNWYKITDQITDGWVLKSKLMTKQPVTQPETPVVTQEPEITTPEKNEQPVNNNDVMVQPENQPEENKTTSTETTETNKSAIVIVETARVRKTASTKSDIIGVLDEDDIVTIIGEEGEFYKITSSKIESGYISKTLVKEKNVTSRSATEEREKVVITEVSENENQPLLQESTSNVTGNEIVSFAKQFLGYPYVLGCSSPEKGFDCSGFTKYIFGHFGYSLGATAASQTDLGSVVERENLQTGDLILFYNDAKTKIGHCGIYLENGDFIHSANPQRGVVIDNLNTNSYYDQRFVTARRIVF